MAVNQAFNNNFRKFQRQSKKKLMPVRVIDIILDSSHPSFEEYGHFDSIGTIFFSKIEDQLENESSENANIARPIFSYIKHYPLINEVVLIITTTDKGIYNNEFDSTYYLPSINVWNHPHHNALPEVRNLKQEGRFGNSIRFGSTTPIGTSPWSLTSQEENMGDPITVIRNGQSTNINTEESWIHTVENINYDPASIYLTSNQKFNELRTAGVITADEFTISWPSFGVSDPISTREPNPQPTNTEDLTQQETQEIVQGEEEIEELTEITNDLTIISILPESESEEIEGNISVFVKNLFGSHLTLGILPGFDDIYSLAETDPILCQDGDTRVVYYPYKENEPVL